MSSNPAITPKPAGRDHRVDFWRGVALMMIFVNHIPGTIWENVTSRNFGFSDAAEVFVFLAGFASAFAYGKGYLSGDPVKASIKALRRAGVLYLVHILLTVMAIALFAWSAFAFGRGELLQMNNLAMFLTRPLDVMIGIPTLGHQLGYVNILPMYSAILVMLPVLLLVARYGRHTMLLASAALWVACGIWRFDMPNFPQEGGWFFNPFAWQFLFALGLYCGLSRWQRGYAVAYSPLVYCAALAYVVFALVFVSFDLFGMEQSLGLPFLLGTFDKTYLTAPRLLHVLAVIYVFAYAPKTSPISAIRRENPLAVLGRHSLPIFATGTMLSLAGQVIRYGTIPSVALDTVLIVSGLAIQFALARYLDWWRDLNTPARQTADRRADAGGRIGAAMSEGGARAAPAKA
ncbi:OpgC family protein [Mangrovicella endophytica]|uniref:OpgC family protein n=1 Tax=Mangrovicella endophytica TaxID=2066697 RepID=UPI000C9EB2C1|nr:OpgC domain-containing protein [Mangrovicella endophytica]